MLTVLYRGKQYHVIQDMGQRYLLRKVGFTDTITVFKNEIITAPKGEELSSTETVRDIREPMPIAYEQFRKEQLDKSMSQTVNRSVVSTQQNPIPPDKPADILKRIEIHLMNLNEERNRLNVAFANYTTSSQNIFKEIVELVKPLFEERKSEQAMLPVLAPTPVAPVQAVSCDIPPIVSVRDQVIPLVDQGYTDSDIATRLKISRQQANYYRNHREPPTKP